MYKTSLNILSNVATKLYFTATLWQRVEIIATTFTKPPMMSTSNILSDVPFTSSQRGPVCLPLLLFLQNKETLSQKSVFVHLGRENKLKTMKYYTQNVRNMRDHELGKWIT